MPHRKNRRPRSPRPATEQHTAAAAPGELGLVLDREEASAEVEALIADREPLFTVDGVTYTIPKVCPSSWSLMAWTIANTRGASAALSYATENVLGPEAMAAMIGCRSLTKADTKAVLQAVMDRVLPDGLPFPKA
ncbi:hypothetical protein [Amycolatopsis tolypomycina]|uniref:hypothetical protein n=1 Tax=Amycolatopsis tolypomycina TaxID=208445 RepID=UPI0033ACA141